MKQNFVLILLLIFSAGCQRLKEKTQPKLTSSTVLCAPIITDREWYNSDNKAPLFSGLGNLHFPISTDNELVQRYFNQGLVLAYGFNHAETARYFYYASNLTRIAQWLIGDMRMCSDQIIMRAWKMTTIRGHIQRFKRQ